MKSTRSPILRRIAALAAGSACLFTLSTGAAETPSAARSVSASGDLAAAGLRTGSSADLAGDQRRTGATGPSTTLAPAPARTFYETPPSPADGQRTRLDDLDGIAPGEDRDRAAEAPEEPFDLMDGPATSAEGRRAARPDNLASSPAQAAGTYPDSAAILAEPPAGSSAAGENDLLIDAQRRSVRSLDLAVPASAATSRGSDGIGGRINLPVTGLRPSVPLDRDDAFAPVGIRAGSFVLYSTLDQSLGASTNLSRSPGGASGGLSETELALRLLSDWSRHQAELNGLVSYRRNFEGLVESEPKLALDGRMRLDIDRLTSATFTGAVQYRKEDPVELSPFEAAGDRPDILTYSAGAKVERAFGRAKLGVDATTLRETTSREERPGFASLDENYTTTTAGLRAGYELSPAIQPFVAGSLGRRSFDEERSFDGLKRDSLIQSLRGGLAFDLGEKFLGEFAAGYAWNVPDEAGLETLGAPTVDARIVWSPQRGTDLVFSAATSFEPDTLTATTSTLYEGGLALRHRLTARTDLTGALSVAYRDADIRLDRETSYGVEAGFVHWLNRTFAVTGLVRHERLDSETPGGDYDADSVRIGLRVQR
ncbi:hypothetical protein ASG54_22180 [Aureimonas sp. Leaf460]|nr:hypothetical protein ASG62_15770 [Aureimonas sp. Leaf427]KQT70645.1 hypothetical protein ASG54_22180 [Aureimonas sp. Leaf460]